jgi:hypothetical protein
MVFFKCEVISDRRVFIEDIVDSSLGPDYRTIVRLRRKWFKVHRDLAAHNICPRFFTIKIRPYKRHKLHNNK